MTTAITPYGYGQRAFAAGIGRAPSLDSEFCATLGLVVGENTIALYHMWLRGWDAANLAAPIKEVDGTIVPALPSYDELLAFLRTLYKYERLDGREQGYPGYVEAVVSGRLRDLERNGYDLMSHHESRTGEVIAWDVTLQTFDTIAEAQSSARGRSFLAPNTETQALAAKAKRTA